MAYDLIVSELLDKKLLKLNKKNPKNIDIIENKVKQIQENPYHFKPLRGDLHGTRRVHIAKSFVLTYEIDEKNKKIVLLDLDHHDNIY